MAEAPRHVAGSGEVEGDLPHGDHGNQPMRGETSGGRWPSWSQLGARQASDGEKFTTGSEPCCRYAIRVGPHAPGVSAKPSSDENRTVRPAP